MTARLPVARCMNNRSDRGITGGGRVGGARFARPDGVHFTGVAATLVADEWLAEEVVARADAARAAAVACLSDSDAQPAISVAVCRAEPGEPTTE